MSRSRFDPWLPSRLHRVRSPCEHTFVPPRYSEDAARDAIGVSMSWSQALRLLGMRPAGGNWKTLQRYAHEVWGISTDHFDPNSGRRAVAAKRGRPLEEVLV